MVTKKAATAVVKSAPGGAVALPGSWKDRLAQYAKQATDVANETGAGRNTVSFRAGQMAFNKEPVAGNKLDTIILDGVIEHAYYAEDFDKDNPVSPVCFALGRTMDEMKPHPDSSAPQSEKCKGCKWNEFGTADKGKGKACKNSMRLALLPGDKLTAAAIEKADKAFAKLPVTSVKEYTAYAKRLGAQGIPPFAVMTEITCAPDPKTQVKVSFNQKAPIADEEAMEAVIRQHDLAAEEIMYPYPKPEEGAAKPAAKKTAAKKPAAKRKY